MNNLTNKPTWIRRTPIGKGSFGVVTLAESKSESEAESAFTFAVKSVEKNSINALHYLENEIRILKSLSSPFIVSYLGDDVTFESSSTYRNLHLEYMPGGTIADVAGTTCCIKNLKSYTFCITSALRYIHSRNIVHCDVKGANVLLGKSSLTAKLADFGSAVVLGFSSFVTRGSPLWMAPEVVRGEYIGPESDVWSLGCTVTEMITGKPPWQDRGAETLRRIGYSDELPEIPSPLPEDLRDFIKKCLKRDRRERWSCDQLLRHRFLLSCTSASSPEIIIDNNNNLSPRCVCDWSDLSSSNESTVDTCQFNMKECDAKQRIGKLAGKGGVEWETEGWEVVRHVREPGETTKWEYSDSNDEEESGSGRGGVNWEYTESDGGCNEGVESTSGEAWSTMGGWICRDSVDVYRCYMYVWIGKLLQMIVLNLNVILYIYYTQWLPSTPSLLRI